MTRFFTWLWQLLGFLPVPPRPPLVVPAKLVGGKLVASTRNPASAWVYDKPPWVKKLWTDIADDDLAQRLGPNGDPAYVVTPGVHYFTREQWRAWADVRAVKT